MGEPGLTQNEISKKMNLKPSTITRLIDKLMQKDLVQRVQKGREVHIFPTEQGKGMQKQMDQALKRLYKRYIALLGKEFAEKLTADIHQANLRLQK